MLVAMTGGEYEGESPGPEIVTEHIIPAVLDLHSP